MQSTTTVDLGGESDTRQPRREQGAQVPESPHLKVVLDEGADVGATEPDVATEANVRQIVLRPVVDPAVRHSEHLRYLGHVHEVFVGVRDGVADHREALSGGNPA